MGSAMGAGNAEVTATKRATVARLKRIVEVVGFQLENRKNQIDDRGSSNCSSSSVKI